MLKTWIFDRFWNGSKMTVKTRVIRQKEPKGERTFGADRTVQGKSFDANNKLQSLPIRALYEAYKPLFD